MSDSAYIEEMLENNPGLRVFVGGRNRTKNRGQNLAICYGFIRKKYYVQNEDIKFNYVTVL